MTATVSRSGSRLSKLVPTDPIVRRLAVITIVNTFGNGLFFTLSALYFTRIVGLSVTAVGLGLTVAGGLGVLAGVPFGHAADRFGTRRLLVILVTLEAAGTASYTLIHSFVPFLLAACATTVFDRGSNAVRAGMFAVVLPVDDRVKVRAYLRAVTNVGIGAGSATAALALQADTRAAYVSLILVDALTYLIAAAILIRLPVTEAAPAREDAPRRRNRALSDRPYLVVTALNAVLALQFGMIEVGLPLWIVGHTRAPRAMVAATLLANCVLVVALQVRASRGVDTVPSAARAARRGGFLLAACCLLFAVADGVSAWAAALLLLAGIITQSLAEVMSSAAGWALSYDLAHPDAPAAYQGVFMSGFALAGMLAPIIVTSTALHHGLAGWVLLGAVFATAGLALAPATRWAVTARTTG